MLATSTALWPWPGGTIQAAAGGCAPAPPSGSSEPSDGSGGCARWTPSDPRLLLGRRVRRSFAAGVFDGVVRGTRLLPPDDEDARGGPRGRAQQLWLVCYADGDREELSWHELLPALRAAPEDATALPPPGPAREHTNEKRASEPRAKPPRRSRFKGVVYDADGAYRAQTNLLGRNVPLGGADTAAGAARLYDAEMRRRGRRVVNFPTLPGEVQAVWGESDQMTLRRLGLPADSAAAAVSGKGAAKALPGPPGARTPEARSGGAAAAKRTRRAAAAGSPRRRRRVKTEEQSLTREATPLPPADSVPRAPPALAAPAPGPSPPAPPAADGAAAVRAFLRRISPPIKDAERVVAAVPPRMTMAQLLSAVARDTLPADREAAVHCLASILGIDDAADRLTLLIELQAHARRAG